MRMLRFTTLVLLLAAGMSCACRAAGQPPPSFAREIKPLLEGHCWRCHRPTARKGGLDLETPEGLRKGGESGAVIVPGKSSESPLYEKVHEGSMPPDGKGRLSPVEVAAIGRWIDAGARIEETGPKKLVESSVSLTQHEPLAILMRHCTVCHGLRRQDAGLDVRSKASLLRGGKSGPAIVSGKPDESLLVRRIAAGQMPPPNRMPEASVKPVDPGELDLLTKWIAAGAPEIAVAPDVATSAPDPEVSDKDRAFWAFRPPKNTPIPRVSPMNEGRSRNPIDAFLLAKLASHGLSLSAECDRAALLRRASFDLLGLPPEPSDVLAFVNDPRGDAYERAIDRLLASPRYGERWGNFWLDLAGYADSEGKREQDLTRPFAWRYRDYVIRAFNGDKPYDRFLLEQIAGDERKDYEHAPEITRELCDNLVATAFLRMAPDGTWANITCYLPDRLEVVADEIDVLGSAVMGLTLKCARCHSHKFDPLPQRDYYRLTAVFKGAYDENDWLKPDIRPGQGPPSSDLGNRRGRLLPFVTTAERREWEQANLPIEREIRTVRREIKQLSARADDSSRKHVTALEARIKSLEAKRSPEPMIQALWDRGIPSPTYVYQRGDSAKPGTLVGPGVPSVLTDGKTPFSFAPPWPGSYKTGRRLAFAKWLTRPDHPLTARVAVNRIWQHHFGQGIVRTVGNFGKTGTPPTHPELLDWLAREFIRRGNSVKSLHRLMMTSAAYRQSSRLTDMHERIDPDNALLSRMPMTRLDAESLYDSLLLVAGRLNETCGGPGDPVVRRADGLVVPAGSRRGWRRAVYVQHLRKQIPTHLESFDYPQMSPNCVERRNSTVAVQALHLMNSQIVQDLAAGFGERISRSAGPNHARQVDAAYLAALGRIPSLEERRIGLAALDALAQEWGRESKPNEVRGKALAAYCHAIINSAAFLYVD